MSLNDDIDDIKMKLEILTLSQQGVSDAIVQMADKVDIIVSNGTENTLPNPRIFAELLIIFRLLGSRKKEKAILYVRRLTGCTEEDAKNLVGIICH